MTEDRTKTIRKTQTIERAALVGAIVLMGLGPSIHINLMAVGAVLLLWFAVWFILEALWTLEIQQEEIKENTKR